VAAASELFGDGVFETVHLRPSGPWLLDAHLRRLARSAALLDLECPGDLRERVRTAVGDISGEAALRIILTRQSPHLTVSPIPPATRRERLGGVRVITSSLGFALGRRPPWSLWAAKTLSYAENFAARRWARGQGADDLILLTEDRYALEAPTASLLWLTGDVLATVPSDRAQILRGTTAARLLEIAPSLGLRASERLITLPELLAADGIWLASALRGIAEVVAVDGVDRERSPWTARFHQALGF
jgi:4-amino-4-deoxychorismate lyase